jgi:glycosyl transferase family 25
MTKDAFSTFVISLERATDRRAHMQGLLGAINHQAEFMPAVDGRAISAADRARYDSVKARRDYRCEMSDAEIACYLSHYRIYERMCREGIDMALILEDDIQVAPDLLEVVRGLAAHRDPPWSVVRLQSARPKLHRPTRAKDMGVALGTVADRTIYRLRTHVLGGCAYLIRREAAEIMLSYGSRITRPIDQTLDRYWENKILPYVVRPFPVWQHPDFTSEIGMRGRALPRREDILDAGLGRLSRAMDGVNKRLFNFADTAGLLGLATR